MRLWGRDPEALATLARERCNARYLPDAAFPDTLEVTASLAAAAADDADIVISVPSHALRALLGELAALALPPTRLAWATKGFEQRSGLLPHQVAASVFGDALPGAVLSGPTFAREVGRGLPTAMVVASRDTAFAARLAQAISSETFRAYTSDDIVGVEVGGAVKNVLAIGAGISDGLGFGANTRVALITRGLVEMTRLGEALGAHRDTFMGLAGIGDLVLTCTDDQSRNRRFGLALAAGEDAGAVQRRIGQVVEGVAAARAVHDVASALHVDMPIAEQIHHVLHDGLDPREAVVTLMTRRLKSEDGGRVAGA